MSQAKSTYAAFDAFLAGDTWHTNHPSDTKRFMVILATVVEDDGFNPDSMGEYFREKVGMGEGDPRGRAVDRLVSSAWAVREYLEAIGVIQ